MKRQAFSLLEVLVAVAVLTMIAGAVVLNVHKGVVDRQQKDSLERIHSTLKMASRLAKITHQEVRVIFFDEEGKKQIKIHSDVAGANFLKTAISRKQPLDQVRDVVPAQRTYLQDLVEVSYFPWGIDQEENLLEVQFTSGEKVLCDPKRYMAQAGQIDPHDHRDLFPQEVLQDDEEKKLIHVD